MKNPWLGFDLRTYAKRYVNPIDDAVVDAYEIKQRGPEFQLATHLLPEPWVGRLDAPVVMLLANPGIAEREDDPSWSPSAAERHRGQATLRMKKLDLPYYWLDEELADTDGYAWADHLLKRLIADAGRENVARNLVTLSAHAYHSHMFDDRFRSLPSQRFTIAALRRAIANDALIVAVRARKYWFSAVPELEQHDIRGRVLRTDTVQNVTLGPRTVERYDDLCDALGARQG
jgi:hypothetical protein